MLLERPEVKKALEAAFQREGLNIRGIPEKHAGGKWQGVRKYKSRTSCHF